MVHFGPQMAENRTKVLIQPNGSHHSGLCHMFQLFVYAQSPLHTFPRNFSVDGEVVSFLTTYHGLVVDLLWGSHQLVTDLLWRNWCLLWPLVQPLVVGL